MHPFLINFLVNFRLSPLQCVPNVFRVVMGTTVLMEKLGLNLTVHDITYVYRLQSIGRKQYTLVSRNSGRKLVTGLLDSSKGRDKDYLVITRNWQNPIINCPLILGEPGFHRSHILYIRRLILVLILIFWFFFSSSFFFFFFGFDWLLFIFISDKDFTAKNVKFVERKAVEHLLERPCFIDSGRRPRSALILLGYEPSYKSFQKGPTVKGPTPSTSEDMLVQRQSINIGSVLGSLAPQTSEPSTLPFAPGFSKGESVMKRRKRREEGAEEAGAQQALVPTESSVTKSPSKKRKGKNSRAPQKATGHVSHKRKHQKELPAPWSCEFYVDGRPVNEEDSV